MRKAWLGLLMILLIPIYLIALIVIHELEHTVLARLLGDPGAVFYLVKMEEHSRCLGCTIYDVSKLSWGDNLIVGVGGLFASQAVALTTLFFLRLRQYGNRLLQMKVEVSQLLLKALFLLAALLYLSVFGWLYWRSTMESKLSKPLVEAD